MEWEVQHQWVTTPPPPPSPTAQCQPQVHRPYRAARSAVTSVVKRCLSSHPASSGGTIEAITVVISDASASSQAKAMRSGSTADHGSQAGASS
ncbi:hypothetical protein VO63_31570 [Streptomyces showdoensis]|uniref:Uncharacterized protein n=1 Tax=Streptomyces showdoensis TaxID=68268 RepID=A0A2P2GGH7_STREW|nr:hypothetical protein VO63_31570 [Streptomyces showdoensis]